MRPNKDGLADLKRLRKEAASTSSKPAPVSTPVRARQKKGKKAVLSSELAHVAESTAVPSGRRAPPSEHRDQPQAAALHEPHAQETVLSADDQALFRHAVKAVRRIKDTRRAILPPVATASTAMLRQRRESAVGKEPARLAQMSDHYTPAKSDHDEAAFVRAGCGPDLIKGLKRGKWPVGATLDLHGATQDEARTRIDLFLQSCLTHSIKCVRIVHGKGYGSKNGDAVLKQTVRRWLTQIEAVIAYTECAEQDGGSGAVQVLLRIGEASVQP